MRQAQDKTILLYATRFLQAKAVRTDGTEVERIKGTTEGGVISPLLANVYLHEAFDMWMAQNFPNISDDCIAHCTSEKQAEFLLDKIRERFCCSSKWSCS